MPRDGSGNFTLVSGNPVVTNTVISSSGWANPTMSDFAAGLTQSLSRDGQTTPTANLTMGNFRLLALAAATTRTDATNAGQIQDGGLTTLSSVSGTDTITASTAPAITVYTAGQTFDFIAAGANATNVVTININGLGAKAVMKIGSTGLVQLSPGDLVSTLTVRVRYDGTQFQVISLLATSSTIAYRNKLINGNFKNSQRNSSFAVGASGIYTLDQWVANAGTGGSATVSVQTVAVSLAGLPSYSRTFLQFAQTVQASAGVPAITQPIESVRTLAGKTVTFSITANVTSGTLACSAGLAQNFGTGGSPSATVLLASQNFTLTTTPTTFSFTFNVPSIAGKTIGSNSNDFLNVAIQFPIGATFTAQIIAVQVEEGTIPTPFENRPDQIELSLCQRFYVRVAAIAATAAGTYSQSLPVFMRATPAVTLVGITGGTGAAYAMANSSTNAFYQSVANSLTAFADIGFDASL